MVLIHLMPLVAAQDLPMWTTFPAAYLKNKVSADASQPE